MAGYAEGYAIAYAAALQGGDAPAHGPVTPEFLAGMLDGRSEALWGQEGGFWGRPHVPTASKRYPPRGA